MPKPDRKVVIIGEPVSAPDVTDMARLIVRFARFRQAKLADVVSPASPPEMPSPAPDEAAL